MDQLKLRFPGGTAAGTTESPLRQVNSEFYLKKDCNKDGPAKVEISR
jgi:hypothetical protein